MRRRLVFLVAAGFLLSMVTACGTVERTGADRPLRVLAGSAASLDPAGQGDAGSAAISAQLFETLTTFDTDLALRPALADSWDVEPGGRRVVFHLRPALAFSDGSPLRAGDVVRSWLRLIDPAHPSPLASFMLAVTGAPDYLRGGVDASGVGLRADDGAGTVTVDLSRPTSDFIDMVASPIFGVVPTGATDAGAFAPGSGFVASGGYVASGVDGDDIVLTANPHYWAGPPAIGRIELVSDTAGQSPVELFESRDLDYVPIFDADASWIAYDATLGPSLREVRSMATTYYGFDASRPPFSDARVRQAFGMAIDWRRIALLGSSNGAADVATSMVPPGIPGRSSVDFLPRHDPVAARAALASAGFPGGRGFPSVTIVTDGGGYDDAIIAQVKAELGIDLRVETMAFDDYTNRLATDVPAIWRISWVADYPGRNDFLGVLLGGDSTNDFGHWTSSAFDAALADAAAAADPAAASAAYDRAEGIVQDQVPVVPLSYGTGWALSRAGLLGADQNGMGIIRMAGLAWAP